MGAPQDLTLRGLYLAVAEEVVLVYGKTMSTPSCPLATSLAHMASFTHVMASLDMGLTEGQISSEAHARLHELKDAFSTTTYLELDCVPVGVRTVAGTAMENEILSIVERQVGIAPWDGECPVRSARVTYDFSPHALRWPLETPTAG
jgi:hypothetical protein